jgi:cysteine synthase A
MEALSNKFFANMQLLNFLKAKKMLAQNSLNLIGSTPLLKLDIIGDNIYGKCEFMNPNGSVKDRIAQALIEDGLKSGAINQDSVLIEATSGNTGIALAAICAARKLRLILAMPSSMTIERQKLLKAYGAELELTPPELGMKGAVAKAGELADSIPNSFQPKQFENPANPKAHYETTGPEIWADTNGEIDIFIAAVGTGGTISGAGKYLKEKNPNIIIIAVEPTDSPVLSGGKPGPHKIQGIGAGFIPKTLDTEIYSEIIQVSNDDAFSTSREIAKSGILVGISAGANVFAAKQVAAREEFKGKKIVTILCDTGERYLSSTLFENL